MDLILSDLGYVDILLILFVLWGLFEGFVKGFSVQVSKFIAMIIGISTALIVYEPIAKSLSEQTHIHESIITSLVLYLCSVIISFILHLVFALIGKIVSFQFVYFVERVLGSLLGGIRLTIYFSFLSFVILLWPTELFNPYFDELSYTGKQIRMVIPAFKEQTDMVRGKVLSKYLALHEGTTE